MDEKLPAVPKSGPRINPAFATLGSSSGQSAARQAAALALASGRHEKVPSPARYSIASGRIIDQSDLKPTRTRPSNCAPMCNSHWSGCLRSTVAQGAIGAACVVALVAATIALSHSVSTRRAAAAGVESLSGANENLAMDRANTYANASGEENVAAMYYSQLNGTTESNLATSPDTGGYVVSAEQLDAVMVPSFQALVQVEQQSGSSDPVQHLQVFSALLGRTVENLRATAREEMKTMRKTAEQQKVAMESEVAGLRAELVSVRTLLEDRAVRAEQMLAEHGQALARLNSTVSALNASVRFLLPTAPDGSEHSTPGNSSNEQPGAGQLLPSQLVNASDPAQFNRTMTLVLATLDNLFVQSIESQNAAAMARGAADLAVNASSLATAEAGVAAGVARAANSTAASAEFRSMAAAASAAQALSQSATARIAAANATAVASAASVTVRSVSANLTAAVGNAVQGAESSAAEATVAALTAQAVASFAAANASATAALFSRNIVGLKGAIGALSTTLAVQQTAMEQRVREEGNSGISGVRTYSGGVESYNEPSHVMYSVLNIHDHANGKYIVGMGELSAVLNGVPFQTRHNDYSLRDPDAPNGGWIDYPDVPPAVLAKGDNVTAQVLEMREWFRAWQANDWSVRDFRPYFRPVMCVLEGAWLEDDRFKDPFDSERHEIDATSWEDLYDKLWYTFASGGKHSGENLSFMPTSIRNILNGTWPQLSRWDYRIKCHKLSNDTEIPPMNLRVAKDLHVNMMPSVPDTPETVEETRRARFEINQVPTWSRDRWPKPAAWYWETLDSLMEQVPGRGGPGGNLTDMTRLNEASTTGEQAFHFQESNEPLNTAYYSRFYKFGVLDAMGRSTLNRGFRDTKMWAAMTTDTRVTPVKYKGRQGKQYQQRWTWSVPLELIYLTPLAMWNPHGIEHFQDFADRNKPLGEFGNRTGSIDDPDAAYVGTSDNPYFYRTPVEFYESNEAGDPADTSVAPKGVLDREGKLQRVSASGTWIALPSIGGGVGKVRLRYPIAPVHWHGSTAFKESKALAALTDLGLKQAGVGGLEEVLASLRQSYVGAHGELSPSSPSASVPVHVHDIFLNSAVISQLEKEGEVTINAATEEGHSHTVVVRRGASAEELVLVSCDGAETCWDGHDSIMNFKATS